MKPILVLYATREGHTRSIAEHVADAIRRDGLEADTLDVAHLPENFTLDRYCAAILSASVHFARHEREMVAFVKHHVVELKSMPTSFLSVSLSAAGAEDRKAAPERRAHASADVKRLINAFLRETGWRPDNIRGVAGALRYTKYNFLVRFLMKRIAREAGGDTDTSRDYVYTDWNALDQMVDELTFSLSRELALSR